MNYRKVAKAFATKHNLEYVEDIAIVGATRCHSIADINAWNAVVTWMLKVYGIDRYVFEMWSEIVERGCDKRDTAVYKEWGVNCAYCAKYDCYYCPLRSCSADLVYEHWVKYRDVESAIVIRDIAKGRMNELS